MRILHIEDAAGVGFILAKYQQRQGHESKVIKYIDHDKYGIVNFYRDYCLSVKAEEFAKACAREAEAADIIHIHSVITTLFMLRKKFGRSKKIILHYHGTDIRRAFGYKEQGLKLLSSIRMSNLLNSFPNLRKAVSGIADFAVSTKQAHFLAQRLADSVLVSTPDLLEMVPNAIYLPNPVDTDHFRPVSFSIDRQKDALIMVTEAIDIRPGLDHCRNHNISLEIEVYDRTKSPIMYSQMPDFLRSYKVYVDIRYVNQRILANLSKTALESLASGLTVLDYQLKSIQKLPDEHLPVNVVSQLEHLYIDIK